MKEEVERIKKLVGVDHNRWEQPCTCDKCKNMCEVPCIGTPKDIEAIIDAGYADRLKETMWMVGYLAVKEKPIAMIQPTVKDGWCAFRRPDGLCELHDRGLKPTEGGMIEIIRYRLPIYWACALINGDYSGLSEEEIQEIDAFLKKAEGYPVDVDLETQGFYRCNDAGTLPGECADFIFHKCND